MSAGRSAGRGLLKGTVPGYVGLASWWHQGACGRGLVFHRRPELAIVVGSVVEEAAQAGINAAGLGGPAEIPEDLRAAALQRAMAFDSRGTIHA
jgi:hypothetical protein